MNFTALVLSVALGLGLPALASSQAVQVPVRAAATRPPPLVPLYVAFVTAQTLDVHSSRLAISRGGVEMNAVMREALTNRPWLAVAVKSGVTAGVMVGSERLWRRNRRRGAIVLMAAVTALQLGVDAHNYRVAAQLR
jgi:hypothetical protein